jgi:hypothetical protein
VGGGLAAGVTRRLSGKAETVRWTVIHAEIHCSALQKYVARPSRKEGRSTERPGDTFDLAARGDVLFLPLMVPWGAARTGVELVGRLGPKQVIPAHDFYLSDGGRAFIEVVGGAFGGAIAARGVEFVPPRLRRQLHGVADDHATHATHAASASGLPAFRAESSRSDLCLGMHFSWLAGCRGPGR